MTPTEVIIGLWVAFAVFAVFRMLWQVNSKTEDEARYERLMEVARQIDEEREQ